MFVQILMLAAAILSAKELVNASIHVMRGLLEEERIATIRAVESQSNALRVLLVQQRDELQQLIDRERHHMPHHTQKRIDATMTECSREVLILRESLDVLEVLVRREYDATLTNLLLELTKTQIEESRKAIRQASTVTRLTISRIHLHSNVMRMRILRHECRRRAQRLFRYQHIRDHCSCRTDHYALPGLCEENPILSTTPVGTHSPHSCNVTCTSRPCLYPGFPSGWRLQTRQQESAHEGVCSDRASVRMGSDTAQNLS